MIDLQEWAKGLLDDQKPLEVLYMNHPETNEEIVILKVNENITLVRRSMETVGFINLIGQMANNAWEKWVESTRVSGEAVGGTT